MYRKSRTWKILPVDMCGGVGVREEHKRWGGCGDRWEGCMRMPEFSLVCYSSGAIHLVLLVVVCLLVVET